MDLFWIACAFGAGLAARALRMPTLVGYLGAGIVLALAGFESSPVIQAIGDFGVMLLLFTIGLHLSLRSLLQVEVLGVGAIHLLLIGLIFLPILLFSGLALPGAALLAVGLGFSSTVLTAKSLDARGELTSFHGRLAIGILVLQDLVAVLLLLAVGSGMPGLWTPSLLLLILARPWLQRLMRATGRDELLLLFGLLMAMGVGALFDRLGLDAKLGALAAGMLLAGDPRADDLHDRLWSLKEVFLVGFFLQIGLVGLPDARGLASVLVMLLLLPLKGLVFFVLMLRFGLRARTAFLASVSLSAYSEFALIVAASAAASGWIEPGLVASLGLLVALSYALNAPVSRAVNTLWLRLEARLSAWEREVAHPDHEPESLGVADYVVLGMGRAGSAAYDYLVAEGALPIGLDADPAQLAWQKAKGRNVIYGDAKDPELWTGLDLSGIRGVLMAIGQTPEAEALASRSLRAEGYTGFVAALLRYEENRAELEEARVTVSFLPMAQAGRELAQASLEREAAAKALRIGGEEAARTE
jgi:predicted Kef-type K+ transport protein